MSTPVCLFSSGFSFRKSNIFPQTNSTTLITSGIALRNLIDVRYKKINSNVSNIQNDNTMEDIHSLDFPLQWEVYKCKVIQFKLYAALYAESGMCLVFMLWRRRTWNHQRSRLSWSYFAFIIKKRMLWRNTSSCHYHHCDVGWNPTWNICLPSTEIKFKTPWKLCGQRKAETWLRILLWRLCFKKARNSLPFELPVHRLTMRRDNNVPLVV